MFEELASALQANGGSATGQMDAGMLGLLQKALQSTNGVTSPSDPSGLTGGAALRVQSLEQTLLSTIQENENFRLFNLLQKSKAIATVDEWTEQNGVGGFLGGSIFTGVIFAMFMSNAGGLWDNGKKYIEAGHHGGPGSDAHKAAVVGDTVGDPFKDTAGPSINTLITVMSLVSSLFAPVIAALTIRNFF